MGLIESTKILKINYSLLQKLLDRFLVINAIMDLPERVEPDRRYKIMAKWQNKHINKYYARQTLKYGLMLQFKINERNEGKKACEQGKIINSL